MTYSYKIYSPRGRNFVEVGPATSFGRLSSAAKSEVMEGHKLHPEVDPKVDETGHINAAGEEIAKVYLACGMCSLGKIDRSLALRDGVVVEVDGYFVCNQDRDIPCYGDEDVAGCMFREARQVTKSAFRFQKSFTARVRGLHTAGE